MGLFTRSADREAQVREHNLDVDYGFTAVSTKEDMDRLHKIKMLRKKTEHY